MAAQALDPCTPLPGVEAAHGKAMYAVFITGSCNLDCQYCYLPLRKGPQMDPATQDAVLAFIARRPAQKRDLGFFGVEPLLAFGVIERMVPLALRDIPGVTFSLNTNGTLLTPEILGFCAQHRFQIAISVDGAPEHHDRVRPGLGGRPSWDAIARHMDIIRAYRPTVFARMTITPANAKDLARHVAAVATMGFCKISFSPNFTTTWSGENLASMRSGLWDLGQWYATGLLAGADFRIPSLESIGFGREVPDAGLFCGAGDSILAIDTDGTVYPCWRYAGNRARAMGNVCGGSFDAAAQRPFTSFDSRNAFQQCSGCGNQAQCGRCAWVGEFYAGGMDRITEAQHVYSQAVLAAGRETARRVLAAGDRRFIGALLARQDLRVESIGPDHVIVATATGRLSKLPFSVIAENLGFAGDPPPFTPETTLPAARRLPIIYA